MTWRERWNWYFDLPRRRGGNWSFIPLEVRDTQHASYRCWVFFIKMTAGRTMGPRATLAAWCAFLDRFNRMQAEYFGLDTA